MEVIGPETERNMNDASNDDEKDYTSYASVFRSFSEFGQEMEEFFQKVELK